MIQYIHIHQCEVYMNSQYYSDVFHALGDETRVRIMLMLSQGDMCACKLLETFKITQPTLSHHLKVLVKAGLVNCQKDGKWCHYSLNQKNLEEMRVFFDFLEIGNLKCACQENEA